MTYELFIAEYKHELLVRYEWASNPGKLENYMYSVMTTIRDGRNTWFADGEAAAAAFHSIGGKGKVSLKKLRALK